MALATLHQLRDLGITIAMDDFGTGLFVARAICAVSRSTRSRSTSPSSAILPRRQDCIAIVRAVIGLGSSLGIIDDRRRRGDAAEQLSRLRAEGCNEVQGFLFSPALSAADVEKMLRRRLRVVA